MQINTIGNLKYLLNNIIHDNQGQKVHKLLGHAYQEYKDSGHAQHFNVDCYLQAANHLVNQHIPVI